MTMRKALDKVVAGIADLPAMPTVVSETLAMIEDATVPLSSVGAHIERDPALAAKILRIANSPYFGMRQYVGTLQLALVILGLREVRNIVIGVAVLDTLRDEKTEVLLADDFWNHSFTVAALSQRLARVMKLGLQGEDFIAGLLHDIGKMVLCRHARDAYAAIYAAASSPEDLVQRENEVLGFNHADAAAALAAQWNLPQAMCDAVYAHHAGADRPIQLARDPRICAVVRIANLAARHDFDAAGPSACPACTDEEAWSALDEHGAMSPAERHDLLAGLVRELADAPKMMF